MDYELKLTQQEAQLVLNALAELPLKFSGAAYSKIQQAIVEQDRQKAISL
jgi:hypothetical protein